MEKELKEKLKKEKKEVKEMLKREKNEKKEPKRAENRRRNEAPHYGVLEEIGNSVTHGVGAVFGIIALIILLLHSNNGMMAFASCVYGVAIFFSMCNSCLYHSFKWGTRVKRLWRRFDYASIYLLIGGTFAPIQLINIGGTLGIIYFCIMWSAIITGIVFVSVFGPGRLRWLHYTLYFIVGWSGLMVIPYWISSQNISLLLWILAGGIAYTLGMIPFAKKGIKGAHFIWHFFVLIGVIVHFIGIFLYIY